MLIVYINVFFCEGKILQSLQGNFFFFNLPYMYGIEISGKYIDEVLSLHVSMKIQYFM